MDVVFLGTASAYPSPTRGVSCVALRHEDGCWIFDCGEGSQTQIMKSQVKPGKIRKLFISHLHGDHLFGLPGLMCTISQNNSRTEPVELYGPEGLCKFLRTSLELSRSLLAFQYTVHEMTVLDCQLPEDWTSWSVDHTCGGDLHPNEKAGQTITADTFGIWHLFEDNRFSVKAVRMKHRVPSFGFVIEEKPLPGKLNVEILREKGIPAGPLYGRLKTGFPIVAPSGEMIRPEDVVGPLQPGRKIIIAGDSSDSSEIMKIGRGADLLVHEATLADELQDQALENGHSTAGMAAKLAVDLGVQKLVLTHFSQRYKPESIGIEKDEESVSSIRSQAKQVTGSDIEVICAEDLMTVVIPLKKPT